MAHQIRGTLLPETQRRTLDELTGDLDLGAGDVRAKRTSFWTMLTLSAVIASAGVLSDSTATVIGAMIIAPLSTPIMGIALAIAKRQPNRSIAYASSGALLVVLVGLVFSQLLPADYVLLDNSQIASRVSPGVVDMIAALATGLAGAVALARRDVAAVLPGVAIAISLVPPLAVVGVCLGAGSAGLALGALVLFLSNLLAMVLAGTAVFTALGYAEETSERRGQSRRRAYVVLALLMVVVLVPLAANTVTTYLLNDYTQTVRTATRTWIRHTPGATVTGVRTQGLDIVVSVRSPAPLPPTSDLRDALAGEVPGLLGVRVDSSTGQDLEVRPSGG